MTLVYAFLYTEDVAFVVAMCRVKGLSFEKICFKI